MRSFKLLILFCLFTITNIFAQTPKAVEADLLRSFKKITYWSDYKSDATINTADSLYKANTVFGSMLKSYTEKYPSTINEPFDSLRKERLDMVTSSDSLFRIYSWDTWTGGTMHFFNNVLQYKAGQKLYSILDTSKTGKRYIYYYSNLYTFKVDNKTYYLGVYKGIFSSKDVGEGIQVFSIENGRLNADVKLIKTSSGLHSKLYYSYDFFSVVHWKDRPAITFDADTQTINLPLVDGKGNMTRKFITYKFTGKYFEKVKS